jgi:hypothetical protein
VFAGNGGLPLCVPSPEEVLNPLDVQVRGGTLDAQAGDATPCHPPQQSQVRLCGN